MNPSLLELADEFDWSAAALAEECEQRPDCVRVFREAGRDVGVLVTRRGPGELHVLGLAVEPAARRQGAARALVSDVIRRAEAAADEWIHLEVRADNHAAVALYESCGFRVVGQRPRYYRDGEDALLMSLEVGASGRRQGGAERERQP